MFVFFVFFFFSSRRRHTRLNCDWSSDVCSSDLLVDERIPLTAGGRIMARVVELERENRRRRPVVVEKEVNVPRLHTAPRSEEHTSELQSQFHLVCRLLLEKKK